jgi:hypothetical protein
MHHIIGGKQLMYGRPALGTMLPLAGMTGAPKVIPGIPYAKALQATAGAGFMLYCLVAFTLLLVRIWLRSTRDRS